MNPILRHQQTRFTNAAPRYEQLAHVQRAVADRLFSGLAFLGAPQRILDIGCGTGALTRRLAETWPRAEVEGIDLAPGMIAEARRLTGSAARPTFHIADAATFTTLRPYDVLVSSSTLHWIQPLARTLQHLATLLERGGRFAFALMLEDTLRELHTLRAQIAPDNAPAQRMPSEAAVRQALQEAGLRVGLDEIETQVVHAETAAHLLRDLRAVGVTGGALSRGARPLTRDELQRLLAAYDETYRDERGVRATYQVGYFWGERCA